MFGKKIQKNVEKSKYLLSAPASDGYELAEGNGVPTKNPVNVKEKIFVFT